MNILDELKNLAHNAAEQNLSLSSKDDLPSISKETVDRWRSLFGFSESEAVNRIISHRENIARVRVPDEHWELVSSEKPGYDKEAYEFELDQSKAHKKSSDHCAAGPKGSEDPASVTYLLKVEGTLDTPQKVQEAASMCTVPEVKVGQSGGDRNASFCRINGAEKARIEDSLSAAGHRYFHATYVRISWAQKKLAPFSIAPTLGVDATMPQHRLISSNSSPGVLQADFPVWYFFYGTLAEAGVLGKVLSLHAAPQYFSARVRGAIMKRYDGKYNALVDGPISSAVDGHAYQVMSEEDECSLRDYETDKYEVVRCNIEMARGVVKGLTFRYCGAPEALA